MKNIFFLLILPFVFALPNTVTTLEKCYNTTIVKVNGFNQSEDPSFIVINCTFNYSKIWWECPCYGLPQTIITDSKEENGKIYDITIQYYIGELLPYDVGNNSLPSKNTIYNEGMKRIKIYNNIKATYTPVIIPKLADITSNDTITVIAIIIIALLIMIALIIWGWRKINKEEEFIPARKNKPIEKQPIDDIETELKRLAGLK